MAGLNAPTTPLMSQVPGDIRNDVQRLRAIAGPTSGIIAPALDNVQNQTNAVTTALMKPGSVTDLTVTDASGSLIAWIGSRVVNAVNYFGAWFKTLYIGGSSAADAAIVVVNGNLTSLTVLGTSSGTNAAVKIEDTGDAPALNFYSTIAGVLTKELTLFSGSTACFNVRNNAGTSTLTILQNGNSTFAQNLAVTGTLGVTGTTTLGNLSVSGTISGTHFQDVGAGDSPSFAGVSASGAITGATISATGLVHAGTDVTAVNNITASGGAVSAGTTLNCSALSDVGAAVVTLQSQVATLITQMATAGKAGTYAVVAGNVTVPSV